MTRPLALIAALACLLAASADAQQQRPRADRPSGNPSVGTISGTVVDADTQAPIPTASVAVWLVPPPDSGRDTTLVTGAITDDAGAFRIERMPSGQYYVDISFVGFASERIAEVRINPESRTADLGTIALSVDIEQLEGVEVQAARDAVSIQIDRTVYNTADDPVAAGGTATTVLETIPSVDVDVDGNISLRGSGNVAILVNGKPAPVPSDFVAAYLRSLPAGTIERVEVIPNPSARYEPDGMSGIINIVLKENVDRGLGGTVAVGGDTRGGYSGTLTLSYGKGPWNVSGSYGFRQDEGVGGGSSFAQNLFATPVTFLDQTEDEDENETSHSATLGVDYALAERTSLSASAQLGLRDEAEIETNAFLELDVDEDPTLAYERIVEELSDRQTADFRLGARHDFGGGGEIPHTLDIEARYNLSLNDGDENYDQRLVDAFGGGGGDLAQLQLTARERDRDEASFEINYVRPLGAFRIEAGYKGDLETQYQSLVSQTRDEETGVFAPDADLNNTFDYDQQIHAGYVQAARAVGPLSVQVGLRAETAQTTFALRTTGDDFENDYTSLFPSAFLSYEVSEATTLRASYSRRINRPRTWFLNPFPSLDDPSNPRIGNPALQPEYVSAFEVGLVHFTPWGSFTLTPFFRRTTDAIQRISAICADNPPGVAGELCGPGVVTVRTVENVATNDSYGVELIQSLSGGGVLDGFRGFVSVEGFRLVSDGLTSAGDLANDAFGWGGGLNASYALGPRLGAGGLDLQANVRYRAPIQTAQGRRGAFTFINFAVRKALLDDRASLTLSLRDPFDLAGFNFTIDRPTLYQEFERNWGAQQIGLTFQYTFGQQPERDRRRGDGERGGDFDDGEI
ncbi:MAG: TonB-dependent receptor [Rhodothermaceae bacterium]|nr:TonB-dependent receptor [Rhodothermaceae bacterium]